LKVLILGATGMLGNAVTRFLTDSAGFDVVATARSAASVRLLPASLRARIVAGIDVENVDAVVRLFGDVRPDVVINCVGLIKQLDDSKNPLAALPINALQPHRLARLCALGGARFIHISTDCVFAGTRGNYDEASIPDATDLYGRSKLLGEVDYYNAVTLRTSIIGHELCSNTGLIDWFLSQKGTVKGFTRAVFSGLPTVELARVIRDHVITRPDLRGLYHVSAAAITKYDLLMLVREVYAADIGIIPDADLEIDRSLNSTRFRAATGYAPPVWRDLVRSMHAFG
jgi:dTDP-4-dehydrorhamnose reductase